MKAVDYIRVSTDEQLFLESYGKSLPKMVERL